jgi:putative membrane protein
MHNLFSFWHFDITVTSFIVIITLLYYYTINFTVVKQSVYFFIGLSVIILAVAYLFSAHMITHILLLLIAPPLMILGIPEKSRFQKTLQFFSEKITAIPLISWLAGVGIMWFWHIPYIYHHFLTMQNMGDGKSSIMVWHNVHMLSLWIAGIIFWCVIINPYKQYQLRPLTGVLYLTTACIFCSFKYV